MPTKAAMGSRHQPVLVDELIAWLAPQEGVSGVFVDGTAGGGGHAVALARRLGPEGRLIGLDRDPEMLALAESTVQSAGISVAATWVHAAYQTMRQVLDDLGIDRVQGVVLDLGLSSDQLAREDRGFSFSADGPLDMRFDQSEPGPTAADLVTNRGCARRTWQSCFLNFGEETVQAGGSPAGSWKNLDRVGRSVPPASWPPWYGGASPVGDGTARSTRRPASSRP